MHIGNSKTCIIIDHNASLRNLITFHFKACSRDFLSPRLGHVGMTPVGQSGVNDIDVMIL